MNKTIDEHLQELKTLKTDIDQTQTAAQAVKKIAKNAAKEMVAALKAEKKAKKEQLAAKDEQAKKKADDHKAEADDLLKKANKHKEKADAAEANLKNQQTQEREKTVKRMKNAAIKDQGGRF